MEGKGEDGWSDCTSSINDTVDTVDTASDDGTDADVEPPQQQMPAQMRPEELHEVWRSELQLGSQSTSQTVLASTSDGEQDLTSALRARFMQEQHQQASSSTEAYDSLTQVPESALAALQLSLAGPRSSRHVSVRLWSALGCYHGFCGGYGAYLFLKNFRDPHYAALTWTCVPVWGGVGIMAGEATASMARVLVQSGTGTDENLLPVAGGGTARPGYSNLNYVVDLLHSPVSTEVAERITGHVRQNRALVVIFIVPLLCCYLGMLWSFTAPIPPGSTEWIGVDWFAKLVLVIGAMCCFPCALLLSGWGMFISVPCTIVSDRIRRETSYVAQMQASSAAVVGQRRLDWDRLMSALAQAHEDAVRLGAILKPTVTTYLCIALPVSAWWIALGSTSREGASALCEFFTLAVLLAQVLIHTCGCAVGNVAGIDQTSVAFELYERLFPPWFFFVAAAGAAAIGFYPLIPLATISTACDELVDTISKLKLDGTVVERTGSSTGILTANDKVRIDGLLRYASELNDCQGIGILLTRRRIDSRCVKVILRAWVVLALGLCLTASILTYQEGPDWRKQEDGHPVDQAVGAGRGAAMMLFVFVLVATLSAGVIGVCRLSSTRRQEARMDTDQQIRAPGRQDMAHTEPEPQR
eukprot:COSAG02_NODE_3956_length_5986_cov_18.502633_4_plen_641_part_00